MKNILSLYILLTCYIILPATESSFSDLSLLLWINPVINSYPTQVTKNCYATKTVSNTPFPYFNNVICKDVPSDIEIDQVIKHFQTTPFAWFTSIADKVTQKKLIASGFTQTFSDIHAMSLDLNQLGEATYPNNFFIQEIDGNNLQIWADIVCQARGSKLSTVELLQHVEFLQNQPAAKIKLYIGYNQDNQVIAASMMILHANVAILHWVSTLPESRKQGFGLLMSHYPLRQAQQKGYQKSLLLSTKTTQHLYESLGFASYDQYNIYTLIP